MTDRNDEIRLIAYQIWEEEGRPHGRDLQHWIEAERRWALRQSSPGAAITGQGDAPGPTVPAAVRAPAVRKPRRPASKPTGKSAKSTSKPGSAQRPARPRTTRRRATE